MGIRKLDWDSWIEMDSNFTRFHDTKVAMLDENFDAHVKYANNAVTVVACFEVLDEVTRFLTHRYPNIFQLQGQILHNLATKETFKLPPGIHSLTPHYPDPQDR